MGGLRAYLKVRDDAVVGIPDADVGRHRVVDHAPEGVVKAVGRPYLEAVKEHHVGRGIQRRWRIEGRLQHERGLELRVLRKVENVASRKEVVLGLRAELVFPAVVPYIQVLALEHVGYRKRKVVLLGMVEESRADIKERVAGVFPERRVVDVRDVPVADVAEKAYFMEGGPGLDSKRQAVLATEVQRVGEVRINVGLVNGAYPVGYGRESQPDILPYRAVYRQGSRFGCPFDVYPLRAVEQPDGKVLLGARIRRVHHVHVVHVLRVVRVLLCPGACHGHKREGQCKVCFFHVCLYFSLAWGGPACFCRGPPMPFMIVSIAC